MAVFHFQHHSRKLYSSKREVPEENFELITFLHYIPGTTIVASKELKKLRLHTARMVLKCHFSLLINVKLKVKTIEIDPVIIALS